MRNDKGAGQAPSNEHVRFILGLDAPVAENPVWLLMNSDLETGVAPKPYGSIDKLPKITAKAIREFNEWVADVGRRAPDIAVVDATFSLIQALDTGRAPKVVRECADLLVRMFLSARGAFVPWLVIYAVEELGGYDGAVRCSVYTQVADSVGSDQEFCDKVGPLPWLEKALEAAAELYGTSARDWALLASALCNLGGAEAANGHPDSALEWYEKALHVCEHHHVGDPSVPGRRTLTTVLHCLGQTLLELETPHEADRYLARAERLLREGFPAAEEDWVAGDLAAVLSDRARVAKVNDDLPAAREKLEQALTSLQKRLYGTTVQRDSVLKHRRASVHTPLRAKLGIEQCFCIIKTSTSARA